MSFFNNIGKTIKKASKQISFKNAIKLASSFDPTGIAGSVVGSIQAKKDEKKALQEQQRAEAEYNKAMEQNNQFEAQKQQQLMNEANERAQQLRMAVATNNQAIGGKIGLVAGTMTGSITRSAIETAGTLIDADVKQGLAKTGANLANLTINEWLKLNWWKLLLGLAVLGLVLKMLVFGKKRR
jgi:hypothetical protein